MDAMRFFLPAFTSIAAARDDIDRTARDAEEHTNRNEGRPARRDIGVNHQSLDELEALSARISTFIANYKAELLDIVNKQYANEEIWEVTSELGDEEKQVEVEESGLKVSRHVLLTRASRISE